MPSTYVRENFDAVEPLLGVINEIGEKHGRELLAITVAVSDRLYELNDEVGNELDEQKIYSDMHLVLCHLADYYLDLNNDALAQIE